MLGRIFGSLGGSIGNILNGGKATSSLLKIAGRYLGNYISESSYNPDITYSFSKHLNDITLYPPNIPYIIPIIFGKARIEGRLIWSIYLKESSEISVKTKNFNQTGLAKSIKYHTKYVYDTDFALLLSEGEIFDIGRFWINGKIEDISKYNYRFYKGTEEQLPDPLIQEYEKYVPAFRGIAYIVFEGFPLEDFGNKIPKFEFELIKKDKESICEDIKNICIIPGSGEFVYDTKIVMKTYSSREPKSSTFDENINCHNYKKIADSVYNLEQLLLNYPNLDYVSLVVTWFADDINAGISNIYPAIEDRVTESSINWKVAEFDRSNANLVSRDENNNPNYGGTINDESLIRYLIELKKNNLKILFNPMIFLDINGKAWRGHITGNGKDIRKFFQKYRKFILHYAYITKDYIDSFLIGSELKGLTKIRENNAYPAIEELIKIANDVRDIVGKNIAISYSADWSEYHHYDGYYNLDSLWASPNIDFIGIDAYFPITNSLNSEITIEEIKRGFESGEGFDHYDNDIKLEPPWAWKNIKYWWENYHYNKDGTKTSWIPKSKKIWFTEFGFPSIDKAPNQPNIFYDPKCIDGGIPKYSNGELDFEIQNKSIRAFIEYWQDSDMVQKSFLWAWDARPQPAWPYMNLWNDSHLWLKGHFVNDKLSSYNLSTILKELCIKAGFTLEEIDSDLINENIDGFILDKESTYMDVILVLQSLYGFFAVITKKGGIQFKAMQYSKKVKIDPLDLIKNESYLSVQHTNIKNIFSHIRIRYISYKEDYIHDFLELFDENKSNKEILDLNIPILLIKEKAKYLCKQILNRQKNKKINIILPNHYFNEVNIGDGACLNYEGKEYNFSITNIKYQNYKCFIEGDLN